MTESIHAFALVADPSKLSGLPRCNSDGVDVAWFNISMGNGW